MRLVTAVRRDTTHNGKASRPSPLPPPPPQGWGIGAGGKVADEADGTAADFSKPIGVSC